MFNDKESGEPYFDRYVTKVNKPMHCTIVKAKGD